MRGVQIFERNESITGNGLHSGGGRPRAQHLVSGSRKQKANEPTAQKELWVSSRHYVINSLPHTGDYKIKDGSHHHSTNQPAVLTQRGIAAARSADPNECTQTLVIKVRQGDKLAREALVARFWTPLRRWAHGRLPVKARTNVDTEDLVQIAVMRAVSRLDQFWSEGKGSFLAYLRQILLNELRDEVRRGNRRPEKVEVDEDEIDKQIPSPIEVAVGHECVAKYERTLAALNRRQQSVMVMRIEQCMSYVEIANAIGESPDAVRMMVARAMVKLAAGMK